MYNYQKKSSEATSLKDGLGLFDPDKKVQILNLPAPKGFSTKEVFSFSMKELKEGLESFSKLVDQYKDYEYEVETWNGGKEKVVLGGGYSLRSITNSFDRNSTITLDDYPLPDIWRAAAKEYHLTTKKLLQIQYYYQLDIMTYLKHKDWYSDLIEKHFQ